MTAQMVKANLNIDVVSTDITLTKDLNALSIAITSPANSQTGFRAEGDIDASLISNVNNSTTYAVTGNCNSNGRTVTISADGVTAGTATCNGTTFAATINSTLLSNATHKLTATMSDAGGTSVNNSVYIYKFSDAPTISWDNDIKPLLTTPIAGNTSACIDCHYIKTGLAAGSSNHTMGLWLGFEANGGKPAVPTQGERDSFVFRFGYYKNTTNNPTTNEPNFAKSFNIVNDATETANTVRNRVVRGNVGQSFLYKHLVAASPICTDGQKCETDFTTGNNARMPKGQPVGFDAAQLNKISQWILEGARTDN